MRWGIILGGGGLLFVLTVAALELRLAQRGFQPTTPDSEPLWTAQRRRAADLGERALVLVGSSRIQVDADLDVLRERTGLEPVQLAIDGSSFRPVLKGLANDPAVRGVVIVDVLDESLTSPGAGDAARHWQDSFARARVDLPDFERIEGWLGDAWRGRMRSYADGAQPLTTVRTRALPARPRRQYLVMGPDRSRLADYSRIDAPIHYLARVMRMLGSDAPVLADGTFEQMEQQLRQRVDRVPPRTEALEAYLRASRELAQQAAAIRSRGGQVFFVLLPRSGLIDVIETRRYPRALFWDRFAAEVSAPTLHFEDVPGWRGLQCPDGSHLDFRQRAAFTTVLVAALGLEAKSAAVPPRAR